MKKNRHANPDFLEFIHEPSEDDALGDAPIPDSSTSNSEVSAETNSEEASFLRKGIYSVYINNTFFVTDNGYCIGQNNT